MSDEWDLSVEGLVDSITDLSMENNRLRQLNAELLAMCEHIRRVCGFSPLGTLARELDELIAKAKEATT